MDAKKMIAEVEKRIKEDPIMYAGIALGIGIGIGLLWGRR